MGNLSSTIDSIIKVRNSKVNSIDNAIENLSFCVAAVKRIESLQAKCINGSFSVEDEVMDRIKGISLKEFYVAADQYREKLNMLRDRFSRKSIHISLVGRARMGKSLVIQQITGLDSSIIPSSDGSDCTGTKSSITNSNSSEITAEITFYTEYELINIINTYLEEILHNKSKFISSISQISSLDVNSIKLDCSIGKVEQYLAHLKKYVDHIGEFASNLGRTIRVPKEDIEKYVAQYSHADSSIKYFNFLGVKSVNINTKFPCSEAGKIVLLDTIGIGTTSLGDEKGMLDVVEKDSDAIIFMFRPDALGPRVGAEQVDAIDKIAKKVGLEYAKEMLFWVINKVVDGKGKNIEYISGVIDQINSSSWPVSEVFQVDCKDPAEVEQKLLIPILNKISSNIESVDNLIVEGARSSGLKAFSEYNAIRDAVDTVYYNCNIKNVDKVLGPVIWKTRDTMMKNNLRDLYVRKYEVIRSRPCDKFKTACDNIMAQLFSFIPSTDDVVSVLNTGKDQHATLMYFYDRMRLEIIDAFLSLDSDLTELISDMKNEVLDIFRSKDKGKLELLVEVGGENTDPNKWIEAFLEKTDAQNEYPIIGSSFKKFGDFECTVQGFLIYEIRSRLDKIDESILKQLPKIYNSLANPEKVAAEIIESLNDTVYDIHSSLQGVLTALSKVPNQAMFAAIKDLYDRVFLENRDPNGEDAARQWEYLLMNWKHILWKDDVERLLASQSKAKDINSVVSEVKKYNKQSYFQIVL